MEKKAHTFKELIISNKEKRILYISQTYEGKAHDYGLLKQEFPPEKDWFKNFKVHLDLGFQGFLDLYPCEKLYIPIKKEKATKKDKKELTEDQKAHNKSLSQERVFVEHSIGGMKRYRVLSNRNRLKNKKTINKVIGVCAALWNFTI